jgi:hypothetical protein
MRISFHLAAGAGVLLVAATALAGTPATTSTSTTSTSTTTTTLFGGCVVEASYTSILCRLDALVSYVGSATDLGRVKGGVAASASKARKQCGKASQSTGKVASNQLKKCAKTLDTFRHKLDSHSAKQIVPEATRSYLRNDVASPLRSDVNGLRGTL